MQLDTKANGAEKKNSSPFASLNFVTVHQVVSGDVGVAVSSGQRLHHRFFRASRDGHQRRDRRRVNGDLARRLHFEW